MLLNVHSRFSYRYGILPVDLLVEQMLVLGYSRAVLTDINSTAATLNFIRVAQNRGMDPVVGIDFRNGAQQQFVALAKDEAGFSELNRYLSHFRHTGESVPSRAPAFSHAFVVYPFVGFSGEELRENEYLGIAPSDLSRLKFSPWRFRTEKLVVLHTVTFRGKGDFNTHRLLRAIDTNALLSKLPKSEEGKEGHALVSRDALQTTYAEWPALIRNTESLLDQCHIAFAFGEDAPHRNLSTFTANEQADWERICALCEEGLPYRYPQGGKHIRERLQKELQVIRQKGFLSYFLVCHDLVHYARHKGYFYVGRGSGANSMVAYLLRITDVDPIDLDLYFERFINLFRKNPPDFDIDFSWRDRPDVTRYLFERYGPDRTALLGVHNTFQHRAVLRELGKVFGLPKGEIDRLSEGYVDPNKLDSLGKLVLNYGKRIHGLPSHLSVHAGGILISDAPLCDYTATDLPPKGYPTTHFDMVTAEDAGLYKYDILGQRGLGKIKDTLEVVRQNRPEEPPIDIHDIPRFKADPVIKDLLSTGRTIGCFYVESPAMRMLLAKLRVKDYLGLVAASSIIRPGVSKSGMMREYIKRFRDEKEREKAHPVLWEIMPETFGVMVYQEDVIKVAHYFADLSLEEADVLRRGMSGKYRSREEFHKVRQKFFSNCYEKGYDPGLASDVWRQIESFAGFAFAKGHSASYAVESYQSLFLKAYYPLEYLVATLNNGGGFYRNELYLHEARMLGATVHPPCVNRSRAVAVIHDKDIYLGFLFVQGVSEKLAAQIVAEREREGEFQSLEDFAQRIPVTVEEVEALIRIGAFRFTGEHNRNVLWQMHMLAGKSRTSVRKGDLFSLPGRTFDLPSLPSSRLETLFDQLELLGFPLEDPWIMLRDQTPYPLRAQNIPEYLGKVVTLQGYLINIKNTSTSTGHRMHFGTFIDRDGYWIDTVHFPQIAKEHPFRGRGVYTFTGTVTEEFDSYQVEVSHMRLEPNIPDPRYADDDTPKFRRQYDRNLLSGKDITQDHTDYERSIPLE